MPTTPDRHPGPLEEPEEIVLGGDAVGPPTTAGAMRYVGGAFALKDSVGVFDPRSGADISQATHRTLRQLIHFIDDGPAEGFVSGAYRTVTGTVFPTEIVWWESSAMLKRIVDRVMSWTGVNLTTDQWRIYDTDGSTVIATITDAITYSGIFETSRTRTIA